MERVVSGLNRFQKLVKKLHVENGDDIHEDSQCHRELAGHKNRHLLEPVWGFTTLQIDAAGDHLTAYSRMLAPHDGVITPYAALACVRSMLLEPCAAALWLLDPEIGPRERTKRAFAARYADMVQALKIARASSTEAEISKGRARIQEVAKSAIDFGFDPIESRTGKTIGIGTEFPPSTQLIETQLNMGLTYRVLSAILHAKSWALREASMQQVTAEYFESTSAKEAHAFRKVVPFPLLRAVSLLALTAVARAVWYKFRYGGWEITSLELGYEAVFQEFGVPPNDRFWNTSSG